VFNDKSYEINRKKTDNMIGSSEKVTRAIFKNFKELQCLEKKMRALDLEKSYNISLINLDQKVVKVKYKRLHDKVSKIKSHLSVNELDELKKLEEEGKLKINLPSSDINVKIIAAEKRLKLMPRAKSAVPRLQSSRTEAEKKNMDLILKTPRSARRFRTPSATPRTPEATPRRDLFRTNSQSNKSNTPRKSISPKPEIEFEEGDYIVPKSVREERRRSINIRCIDEDVKTFKVPSVAVIQETDVYDNISIQGSTTSRNGLDIHKIELKDSEHNSDARAPSPVITITDVGVSKRKNSFSKPRNNLTINSTDKAKTGSGSTANDIKKPSSPVTKVTNVDSNESPLNKSSFLQLPTEEGQNRLCTEEQVNHSYSGPSKIRPMSAPATQVTDFGAIHKKNRPKTAMELALETRKKYVIDIQRVSTLLKEGKTRSPFSSHEKEPEDKEKIKPFRSIREGINSTTNYTHILDNTFGDDLHKEMKKGMILGEVATGLYLEEKIDNFLEKVDGYVKENPNYVYDPNAPKTKTVPRKKSPKKSKRNKLHRRNLERQLQEVDIEKMKKSRWLRKDDENLDSTGTNTLVVDQIRMLNKL
jgi:hypothetical protein